MKGFITFSEEEIGTVSWELPKDLQFELVRLPDEFQESLQQELKLKMRDLVLLLKNIAKMGQEPIRKSHEHGDF